MSILSKEELACYILQNKSRKDVVENHTKYYEEKDWSFLFDFSRKRGLFPAFYDRIVNLEIENIPQSLIDTYKSEFLSNLHRNLILEYELFKIIEHLNKNSIPVISLKGPFLGRVLHGDIARRNTSCDLDILVSYDNRKRAEIVLGEMGYSFAFSFHLNEVEKKLIEEGISLKFDGDFREVLYKYRSEVSLVKTTAEMTVNIDLHWDLKDKFIDMKIEDFWRDTVEIAIDDKKVLFPSWETLLFQLTITSIAKYDFISLKYLYDIKRLLIRAGRDFNWESLLLKIKESRLDHAFYFSFLLNREFFNAPVPDEVIRALKPPLLKEKILSRWINKENICNPGEYSASNTWRFIILNYIYVKNLFYFPILIFRRLQRPVNETFELVKKQGLWKGSYLSFVYKVVRDFSY